MKKTRNPYITDTVIVPFDRKNIKLRKQVQKARTGGQKTINVGN